MTTFISSHAPRIALFLLSFLPPLHLFAQENAADWANKFKPRDQRQTVVDEFVNGVPLGNVNAIETKFSLAQQVHKELNEIDKLARIQWADAVIPRLLQGTFSNPGLQKVATDLNANKLPDAWHEAWIQEWLANQYWDAQSALFGSQHGRPLVTHPIIVFLLRKQLTLALAQKLQEPKRFTARLQHQPTDVMLDGFVSLSADEAIKSPEGTFVVGGLILELAAKAKKGRWRPQVDKIVEAIVKNSAKRESVPREWRDSRDRVWGLMENFKVWKTALFPQEKTPRDLVVGKAKERVKSKVDMLDAKFRASPGTLALLNQVREPVEQLDVELSSPWAQMGLACLAVERDFNNELTHEIVTSRLAKIPDGVLTEVLKSKSLWPDIVNRSCETAEKSLVAWAHLGLWDRLRGRDLPAFAPNWDESERATVAAAALLGTKEPLKDLQALDQQLGLDLGKKPQLRQLLAAARIELGLTLICGGNHGPTAVFPDLGKLATYASWALESSVAWESRAGFQACVLLSRLSHATGNDFSIKTSVVNESPLAVECIRLAVKRVIKQQHQGEDGNGGSVISALPLFLVAYDLERFARDSVLSMQPRELDASMAVLEDPWQRVDELAQNFQALGTKVGQRFCNGGGAATSRLLLAVRYCKLLELKHAQRLTIEPLSSDRFKPNVQLCRCLEETSGAWLGRQRLLAELPARAPENWNSPSYWAGGRKTIKVPDAKKKLETLETGPRIELTDWVERNGGRVNEYQMNFAAWLDAETPPQNPPEVDVDGQPIGNFRAQGWKKSRDRLEDAIAALTKQEKDYVEAVKNNEQKKYQESVLTWLRAPLFLDTSDYKEQVEAAIAEVKAAEFRLEMTRFEGVAAHLEEEAANLFATAARVEAKRRETLTKIAELQSQRAKQLEQAAMWMTKNAKTEFNIAKRGAEIAKIYEKIAKIDVGIRKRAVETTLEEINVLRTLLETETEVEGPSGRIKVNGTLAAMAVRIERVVAAEFASALEDVEDKLEAARAAEKRRGWLSGICKFVGAVVGCVIGGPQGASLGMEIGGAVGEVVNGIIDGKSFENVLVKLVDNAFAIAGKANFDLTGSLNKIGGGVDPDVQNAIGDVRDELNRLLRTMPRFLDDKTVNDVLETLDLDHFPVLVTAFDGTLKDLASDFEKWDDLGKIVPQASLRQCNNPEDFLNKLKVGLFKRTSNNVEILKAIAAKVGVKIELLNDKANQREVIDRLADLAIAHAAQKSLDRRSRLLTQWVSRQQRRQSKWNNELEKKARETINRLFPDAKMQAHVFASVRSTLDGERLQGQIQALISPWQTELDERLDRVTAAGEQAIQKADKPKGEVEHFTLHKNALEASKAKFEELLPWLKGNSEERKKLLMDLNARQDGLKKLEDELQIAIYDEDIAAIRAAISDDQVMAAVQQFNATREKFKAAEIYSDEKRLGIEDAKLAKVRDSFLDDGKWKHAKAAKALSMASDKRIQKSLAELEAARARLSAASAHAGKSARIAAELAMPLIRPNAGNLAALHARQAHERTLKSALEDYRELLRDLLKKRINVNDWQFLQTGRTRRFPPMWSEAIRDRLRELEKLSFQKVQ